MSETNDNMTPRSRKKKASSAERIFWAFVIIAVAIPLLYLGIRWIHYRLTHSVTDDAFIEADIISIAPLVSGHVSQIMVDDSQHIRNGQILARIDPRDYEAAVRTREMGLEKAIKKKEAAEVKVRQAKTALELTKKEVKASIDEAMAALNASKARLKLAAKDEKRLRALLGHRTISQAEYDAQKAQYDQAIEEVRAKEAQLEKARSQKDRILLAEKELLAAQKALEVAIAAVKVEQGKLDQAKLDLEHTVIRSPIDGIVAKRFVEPGDFVAPGRPMFSLYDPKDLYVLANLEETKLDGVQVGCDVDVYADAYPHKKIKGKVIRITPAAAAKFALIPRDVTAGEFTKVVQRLPIKIALKIPNNLVLAPGMSVEVGIAKAR